MELKIISYESIGPIKLGMSRNEVRRVLNSKVQEFKKTQWDENYTDSFNELGIHVEYNENNTCCAVEVFEPSNPSFQGFKLIGNSFEKAKQFLLKYDNELVIDDVGLESDKLGISLYAEKNEAEKYRPIEAVIIFEKGYYDE